MKALPLILSASLIANATLVAVVIHHGSSKANETSPSSATATSGATKPGSASAKRHLTLPPELLEALNSNDPEALRDFLREAGLSDDIIRGVVGMQIWKKYEARFKALNPQSYPDPNKPWWKDNRDQSRWNGGMTKAQREESRRLQREVRDETQRLLGPDTTQNRWQDQRLGFLPDEKRQSLQQIQQDYQELMNEVQQDSQGFRLPSDTEKLRFLQEEQKRDIEALMSPEERQAYELRASPTAQQLRWKMTQYDATEEEYRAIFPLQKSFDDRYNKQQNDPYGYGDNVEHDQNYWKERQAAEKQLQDQIKTVIGEQRYADSLRLQDNDWRQLEAATNRLDLPADTPSRLYALRGTTASTVQQIADNPSLGADQKKAALAALANSTRDQIRASLGNEGAEAYFKNNGMGWLKELEKGNTITFRKDSAGYDTKALPKDAKKPAGN